MNTPTRRSFNMQLLGSLTAYGLIETLFTRDLFADSIKPVVRQWLGELDTLGRDLKGQKIKDVEWQSRLEALYRRTDLPELLKFVELDRLAKEVKYPDKGAANIGIDLTKVEGLGNVTFGRQIFAMRKGRSVVPHGHNNMCTGFIILRGDFVGKHYDRVADNGDHFLIKPTIDRLFKPGECSTISDSKDNVHWFKAESDTGFIFNVHVLGYNKKNPNIPGRVYVDPDGERVQGGVIVAKKISSAEAHQKYG